MHIYKGLVAVNRYFVQLADEDDMCRYGNMTMHKGDELKSATSYSSICVKCVCEVPPWVTCKDLSYDECDVSAALEALSKQEGNTEDAEE